MLTERSTHYVEVPLQVILRDDERSRLKDLGDLAPCLVAREVEESHVFATIILEKKSLEEGYLPV